MANCILQSCAATCAKNSHAIQDTWNRKNNNLRKYRQNYVRAGPFANTRVRAYLVGNSAAEMLLNLVSHATVKAIHPRIRLRCMIRAAECWSLMTINALKKLPPTSTKSQEETLSQCAAIRACFKSTRACLRRVKHLLFKPRTNLITS